MFENVKQRLYRNRAAIFTAGMVVGPIVVYAVFHDRIAVVWSEKTLTLAGNTKALDWLIENNHVIDYETPAGVFQLVPPKKAA